MSRWFLTSLESVAQRSARACSRAGLLASGFIADPDCNGRAYHKRAVNSPNVLQIQKGHWVCSAGTLIYRGAMGLEALASLYQDFQARGIVAVRETAIGHYAVAIKQGQNLVMFTDTQGALNLYYFKRRRFWFVSNSLSLCAEMLPDRKVDATKLLVTILQASTPGEETFYRGLKRLFGTQQILINLKAQTFRVETVPAPLRDTSWGLPGIESAIERYVVEVRRIFKEIAAVGRISLLCSGGLDSRTILAALLDESTAPNLMCASGNSALTHSDPRDPEIVKDIAERHKLSFQHLDWSGELPHSIPTLRQLFRAYGFGYEIYGSTQGFLRTFCGGACPDLRMFLGGYGPALTNSKPWERQERRYSFADLVEDAMASDCRIQSLTCKSALRSVLAEEMRVGLKCAGIDYPEDGAPLDTFVRAKLFLRIRAEARMLNLLNEYVYYIAPFVMKELHDPLVSVPLQFRRNDEFQVRLIHALTPELLDVPLCTGWRRATVDRQTFRLILVDGGPPHSFFRRIARALLPAKVRSGVREQIRRVRRRQVAEPTSPGDRTIDLVTTYSQRVMDDLHARHWLTSTGDLGPNLLARMHHYLIGVSELGYSEWIEPKTSHEPALMHKPSRGRARRLG